MRNLLADWNSQVHVLVLSHIKIKEVLIYHPENLVTKSAGYHYGNVHDCKLT